VTFFEQNAGTVGGYAAVPYSWPATVGIRITVELDTIFRRRRVIFPLARHCAGMLLNRRSILTTASCLKNKIIQNILGTTYETDLVLDDRHDSIKSIYWCEYIS
jgi:hypothetical protein